MEGSCSGICVEGFEGLNPGHAEQQPGLLIRRFVLNSPHDSEGESVVVPCALRHASDT
jgi:hypothetical protein